MKPEMKEVHATSTIPLMPKPDSTPLASSYDASSAAASTVARPAVGPTPWRALGFGFGLGLG